VYAAEERLTAFKEVLQDLRPNARAIADFQALFGKRSPIAPAGRVTWAWREKNVLAPVRINASGPLRPLDDASVIQWLEAELAVLLAARGIAHLDISTLTSKDRDITQHISRTLYDHGAAGLRFISDCDGRPCYVVFEGRGHFDANGAATPCTDDIPELLQVCSDYELVLERVPLSTAAVRGDSLWRRAWSAVAGRFS
jgi:hypothetical protein